MKTLITRIKRLALALCLATPIVSWAAPTATAVWRSNLGQSYTIGGNTYALTIPSNDTKASGVLNQDGTVTLTNEWTGLAAPYFDLSATGTENVSVLVKFSGLSIPASGDYGTSLAGVLDSDGNEVGAYVQSGETSLCAFYMASNATSPTQIRINDSDDAVVADGYMLFSYSASSGVKAYVGGTIETLIGGEKTSYNYSNRTISRLLIGGDNGKYYNPNGFTIEDVAVFVGSYLSNDDVADYVFPTVTIDPEITTMSALNTKVAALDNEFLYFTSAASVTLDAEPESATQTFLQSAWNGTVLIKDVEKLNINPTIYGNSNSTLKLSGVSGYFAKSQYPSNVTPQIELENSETEGKEYGFKQTNGYSFNSNGAYAYVNTPKLKGSGTLWGAWNGRAFYVVDDYSEFTGVLKLDTGDVVWLGVSLPETVSDVEAEVLQKYIRLGGTIPANVASWTADAYDGTVRLTTSISSEDSYKGTFLQNSKWKGTCQLAWNPTGKFDIVNYGNANSTIEISSTFSALPTQNGGNAAANIAAAVKVTGDWTVSDGWTDQTTTFAKLSGAGTLTVNGKTNAGQTSAIPYTITTLEGFTGTLAGARGQFTIGTIVSSVEPTPGTKLVNCTTTKEPVLTNTKVTYGGTEQDVELEFKTGDGIYVKAVAYVVFQVEQGEAFVDVTNYYSTVATAIGAAKALKKTVVLVAQPDEEDTYEISVGDVINVKKGDFSFDGIIFPTGAQYNNTTTETAGVTTYKCTVNTVTVKYPGQDPVGMSGELIQILGGLYAGYVPAYAGTVVTVLDGSDATVGDAMPTVFTYNSEAHTYTLKTMVASYNNGYNTVYYPTLAYAVDAVTADGTITLLENVNEAIVNNNDKAFTIDLNGKIWSSDSDVLTTTAGTITINATNGGTMTTEAEQCCAVWSKGGNVVINGGTFVSKDYEEATIYVSTATGTVTINGGTFQNADTRPYRWKTSWNALTLNVHNTNCTLSQIVVYGGTFYGNNPANGDDNLGGTFLASGYVSTETTTGVWTVAEVQEVPVTPGEQTEPVDTPEEAAAEAAKVVPSVPTAVAEELTDEQETAYKALFEAKVVEVKVGETTKYAVEVALTEAAETAIKEAIAPTELTTGTGEEEKPLDVASLATATEDTEVNVETKPGIYYGVKAGSSLGDLTVRSCDMATGTSSTVTFPKAASTDKAMFWVIFASPTPVQIEQE